ncbi:Plant disease resistance response protein [Macleaya cordata]|uniref:Dirigent protein n=1 Tax=Macleaya cordata TaxID=56857 RepID=A0A200R2T7_MACCD|nr:Plant disease resistance response protein [Macleaya cordata]
MGVMAVLVLQFSLVVMVFVTPTQAHAKWGETLPYKMGKEKVTRLHFYVHDTISSENPTAVRVAEAPTTNASSTLFGALLMMDDPLTEGPDPNSKLVGRAQGMYGLAGQKEMSLIMAISLVFTGDDKFNGSTLSVLTRNAVTHTEREFSIVGGTGLFRFARGFIEAKTYSTNAAAGNSIIEYSVIGVGHRPMPTPTL